MRSLLAFLVAVVLSGVAAMAAESQPRILVYTRNGLTLEGKKGYVHDNIPYSVAALKELGKQNGFAVDDSDQAAVFTNDNLKRYRVIVFSNTNNEILDTPEQRAALQQFLRNGGGTVGIHSACGSMRGWPWFWSMMGGSFVRHPKLQEFTIRVVDPKHPSTAHFGSSFRWADEFYFLRDMPKDLHVLLAGDLSTLQDPQKPQNETTHPLAWCHTFEGGRCWYTTLGHRKEVYSEPIFQKHILGGILWAMGQTK